MLIHYGSDNETFLEWCKGRQEVNIKCMIITGSEVLKDLKINLSYNTAIYQKWSNNFFYLEKETTVENIDNFVTIYSRPLV